MEYPQNLEELCNSFGIAFDGLKLRRIDDMRISIAIKEYSQMVKEEIGKLKGELQEQGFTRHKLAREIDRDVI